MCTPRLFARAPSRAESKQLTEAVRHGPDARAARRAQMVLMSHQGGPPARIAKLCAASQSGVRKVLNAFNAGGVPALSDKPRAGRPRKADARYVERLKADVRREPRDLGYKFGCWTLDRLREHLARKTRVTISVAHLSRLMADHELAYRRPKHGMSHLRDPAEHDEKKAFLAFVKKGRSPRGPRSTCCTSTSVRFTSTRR